MKRIGLLSDTHGSLPAQWKDFFAETDEIWHAGDVGTTAIIRQLESYKQLRCVYGNIDGQAIRQLTAAHLLFDLEGMRILMTHIGGHPGRYEPKALAMIRNDQPGLFVCGHSHILRIQYDERHQLMYLNPGAAGNSGFHQKITMLRFSIGDGRITDMEIFETARR